MAEENEGLHKETWDAIDSLRVSHVETQKELSGAIGLLKGVAQRLDEISNQFHAPKPAYNWQGVVMIFFAAIGSAGVFTGAVLLPISKGVEKNTDLILARQMQLPDDYKEFGKLEARAEAQDYAVKKLTEAAYTAVKDIQDNKANVRNLERHLEAVDYSGSRKWIGQSTKGDSK